MLLYTGGLKCCCTQADLGKMLPHIIVCYSQQAAIAFFHEMLELEGTQQFIKFGDQPRTVI